MTLDFSKEIVKGLVELNGNNSSKIGFYYFSCNDSAAKKQVIFVM